MRYLLATVALASVLGAAGTASAQHHHHHHGGHYRDFFDGHHGDPYGGHYGDHYGGHHGGLLGGLLQLHNGIHFGHNDWRYVVPHHSTFGGAYYTQGRGHYYTPSHVTAPLAGRRHVAVEPQRPVSLTFAGFQRYEDLAARLSHEANSLCLDMYYNYRHNRDFAQVYREAYSLLQAANYLHGKAHQGDRETIRRRITDVDRLFHHVQEETRGWARSATRQIGAGALPHKIASVEAVLHHLCYDVGVEPHDHAEAAPQPDAAGELVPPPASFR